MNKKIPMRQCVGCREMKPKKELIRIIRTAENDLLVDATGKKNGRGAYICPRRECLDKAVKGKGIERSLKTAVSPDIYQDFEREMEEFERRQSFIDAGTGRQGK